jgi:putative SOS response-associated peptidase YedK
MNMCGRFVATTDDAGITRLFVVDARIGDAVAPSWNVAPTQPVRGVVEHEGRRLAVTFRWGLVPPWAEDSSKGARLINARAESVVDKPTFRQAYRRRRCLIPADGYYEWQTTADSAKVPYFIHAGAPLAFAGLWETWRDPHQLDAPPLRTCTILTTAAVESVRAIHDRMPLALPPDTWERWLSGGPGDPHLLSPTGARLSAHPVSTAVNHVANNHPGLVEPVATRPAQQLQLLADTDA